MKKYTPFILMLLGLCLSCENSLQKNSSFPLQQPSPPASTQSTQTPVPSPEPSPRKVKTSATVTRTPDYVGQVLIIDGYLDAEGFSCPGLNGCYSVLCSKPGCMSGSDAVPAVGGVDLMMPRSFYASVPNTNLYKKDDVKYRTYDGKIVGHRDRVQLVGKVVAERGGYNFYVQKITKL
jgi:hypothetical protein